MRCASGVPHALDLGEAQSDKSFGRPRAVKTTGATTRVFARIGNVQRAGCLKIESGTKAADEVRAKICSDRLFDRHCKPPDELRNLGQLTVVMFGNGARQTRHAFIIADHRRDLAHWWRKT